MTKTASAANIAVVSKIEEVASYDRREMVSVGEVPEDSILLHESVIRGHHVFKEIWTPRLGEILLPRTWKQS